MRATQPRGSGLRVVLVGAVLGLAVGCSDGAAEPTAPSPGIQIVDPAPTPPQPPIRQGTGLSAPGIRFSAVPKSDGSFDITEQVLLRTATKTIPLGLPISGERLQGLMARTAPQVSNLKVIADGTPVRLDQTSLNKARDLTLKTAATRLILTYRLTGSTARKTPSPTKRAASAVMPLTAGTDGTLPTDLHISGTLRNAVCPLLTETRCAVGNPPRLGVQQGIPAERALVVLQLDLPPAQ